MKKEFETPICLVRKLWLTYSFLASGGTPTGDTEDFDQEEIDLGL